MNCHHITVQCSKTKPLSRYLRLITRKLYVICCVLRSASFKNYYFLSCARTSRSRSITIAFRAHRTNSELERCEKTRGGESCRSSTIMEQANSEPARRLNWDRRRISPTLSVVRQSRRRDGNKMKITDSWGELYSSSSFGLKRLVYSLLAQLGINK